MSHPDRFATPGGLSRNTVIVGSVVALHVAGLWALQSGLLRKAAEVIVPAELLTEFIAAPRGAQGQPPGNGKQSPHGCGAFCTAPAAAAALPQCRPVRYLPSP